VRKRNLLPAVGACLATPTLSVGSAMAEPAVPLPPVPPPLIHVATVSGPMTNTPGPATNAVADCPAGTKLIGGGIRVGRASPATRVVRVDAPGPQAGRGCQPHHLDRNRTSRRAGHSEHGCPCLCGLHRPSS